VKHRVADGQLKGLHKLKVTLIRRLIACDIVLRYTIGAHYAPFVVISEIASVRILAAKPYLRKVLKAPVLIYLTR
jgi:hypothetical protein